MSNPLRKIVPRLRRVFAASGSEATPGRLKPSRDRFMKYLTGSGLEIGALHNPMPLDRSRASVRYADVMSLDEQRRHYPELARYTLVTPDIVAEADALPMLPAGSQDFIIANHLLEHVADPIGALEEWHRLLRPDGILFLALPDKRVTFDKDRPRTTLITWLPITAIAARRAGLATTRSTRGWSTRKRGKRSIRISPTCWRETTASTFTCGSPTTSRSSSAMSTAHSACDGRRWNSSTVRARTSSSTCCRRTRPQPYDATLWR